MLRKGIWTLAVAVCLTGPMAVNAQGDYLDVYIVKVKPEKLADFQALTKKWIDANRKYNGDTWITMETVYGEGNVYQFTSIRKDYADIRPTAATLRLPLLCLSSSEKSPSTRPPLLLRIYLQVDQPEQKGNDYSGIGKRTAEKRNRCGIC